MVRLLNIDEVKYLQQHQLEIIFSDGCIKKFDFTQLLDFTGLEAALHDPVYFANVRISPNQRSLVWQNGYDCCADWLRYFAKDQENEWGEVDDTVDLRQRITLAKRKLQLRGKDS